MDGRTLFALLIFLFPLALYCLALAYLNRGPRPIVISGVWDCIGLLFGLSGFLLGTVPLLLTTLIVRIVDYLPGSADPDNAQRWVWLTAAIYYTALAVGAVWLLAARRHKTVIYNVDIERFGERLTVALAELGLDALVESGRLIVAPAEAFTAISSNGFSAAPLAGGVPPKRLSAPAGGPRHAELRIDTFALFCHVTLHWERYSSAIRHDIERQLGRALEHAAAPDNPAVGWFLGFSGLVFGTIIMFAILVVVMLYVNRR